MSTATNTKRASSSLDETPVLIVGGGPVGLTLALTLAQQGVARFRYPTPAQRRALIH